MEFFRNILTELFRLFRPLAGEESDRGGILAASGVNAASDAGVAWGGPDAAGNGHGIERY